MFIYFSDMKKRRHLMALSNLNNSSVVSTTGFYDKSRGKSMLKEISYDSLIFIQKGSYAEIAFFSNFYNYRLTHFDLLFSCRRTFALET